MSGMDSGMDDSKSLVTLLLENSPPKYILTEWLGLDLDLMNRDRNQGENQGLSRLAPLCSRLDFFAPANDLICICGLILQWARCHR